MKKHFLSGVFLLLPVTITLFIVYTIFDILTFPFIGAVHHFFPLSHHSGFIATILHIVIRMLLLTLILLCITLIGYAANKIFFHWITRSIDLIFSKTPIVRTLYNGTKEIIQSFFGEKGLPFKYTVLTEFPQEGVKAFGFYIGDAPLECIEKGDFHSENIKTLFIPTSPHPISGFLILSDEKDFHKTTFTTEETFKMLISCGIYHPETNNRK